jgi:CRISPR-associated endonuclease/helicase Cas3
MRHLLVVDEVHASDAYMRRLLGHLLRDHLAAGGYAMLLSATLGGEARHQLIVESTGGRKADMPPPDVDAATRTPYPLLSTAMPVVAAKATEARGIERVVTLCLREWLDDPVAVARVALEAAELGAKVLVVRNTVDGAVAVQRALEAIADAEHPALLRVAGVATLHHGRFAREDRRLLDAAVQREIGRTREPGGRIIVGTQTLEQSLDIDSDLLITDLCPVDVLLQRLGRLHRHVRDDRGAPRIRPPAYMDAQTLVLVPVGGLAPFLRPARPGGLRRHGLGHRLVNGVPSGVYRDLNVLEGTRRLIADRPCWRIPTMNRALVEAGLHTNSIDALIRSLPAEEREMWHSQRSAVEGNAIADAQTASDGVLRRDRPFRDSSNTCFDDHLVTRLGANDRLMALPEGTVGPFAQIVRRLAVPGWWIPAGMAQNAGVVVRNEHLNDDPSGPARLRVALGELQLDYDRHGLRRSEEKQ